MIIRQLRVEEGFLDGLKVEFKPGLNVIIGARGTGKTSVIELLRFCLGAAAYTQEIERVASAQAISVLGSGLATVTIDQGGKQYEISRSATDKAPRLPQSVAPFDPPIMLSQSELEKVALDESGRLQLVDDFRVSRTEQKSGIEATQQIIASLTVEVGEVSGELSELQERRAQFAEADSELVIAEEAQDLALTSLKELEPERVKLRALNDGQLEQTVQLYALRDSSTALDKWASSITRVSRSAPTLQGWPVGGGPEDLLAGPRKAIEEASRSIDKAVKVIRRSIDELHGAITTGETRSTELDELVRPIRRALDDASKGAGQLTQQVAGLKQKQAQGVALDQRIAEIARKMESLLAERRSSLEDLETLRVNTFDERHEVAITLNNSLGPLVHVSVERAGHQNAYSMALTLALQGSGLHYNTLAPRIAERMSPRELAEAVERSDVAGLSALADIPEDRAIRIITQLSEQPLSDLLTAWVDDGVMVSLLDGMESKTTNELSTGQRCTAVLPILLQHRDRVLVMDQPEDNLDNAFVVSTLIRAIRERPATSQLIATTHNPNIPVLGDATNVVLLASTGHRGYVESSGHLSDPSIVEAITTVMEGGRAAFARRAEFYGEATQAI